ncbi:hypothetical protein ABT075_25900 [Streptomyces sp. NPDC002677]
MRQTGIVRQALGREGGREYDICLAAPDAKWATYRPVFDNVRDGFRTSG